MMVFDPVGVFEEVDGGVEVVDDPGEDATVGHI
jgi:hypothetical protein